MLEIKGVSKIYGEGGTRVVALSDFSLQVEGGDFIAVMGPSGSGKSTLLNIIGGLERLTSGEVVLEGRAVRLKESVRQSVDVKALTEEQRAGLPMKATPYRLLHVEEA